MLLYHNVSGTLSIERAGYYLRLVWHEGMRTDAQIMELFDQLLNYLKESGCRRVLVNQQRMQESSIEVQVWFRTNWLPVAIALLGEGRAAVVLAQDVFTRLATVSLMHETALTSKTFAAFTYQLFQNEEEALRWLLSEPAASAVVAAGS